MGIGILRKMEDVSAIIILSTCLWAQGFYESEAHLSYNRTFLILPGLGIL